MRFGGDKASRSAYNRRGQKEGEARVQRIMLGDFELTVVDDGGYWVDGGALFGVVPKSMWEKKMAADAQNRVRLAMNSLIIRTGSHTVLVETGAGDKLSEKMRHIFGTEACLLDRLAEAGFALEDFDVVLNTHLHFDHCGWNTRRDASGRVVATFPQARYYFQRGELAHAHRQHERDRVSYCSENYDPLLVHGQAQLLDGDAEIVPGITVRLAPGHTAHHQIVQITSQGQTAAYLGDLIPTAAHLQPSWVMGYDLDPIAGIDQRRRYYETAIPQRWLTIFSHDAATPWGTIVVNDAGQFSLGCAVDDQNSTGTVSEAK